jgi:hypothetical protein
MSDGTLVAVHTAATGQLTNNGSTAAPSWSYQFRLKRLTLQSGFYAPTSTVTAGIQKSVSWWTPDVAASFNGTLWELDPVEVVTRSVPTARVSTLPAIESGVFTDEGVDVGSFRTYLRQHGLALIVSRDVTQRDRADRQQPFNLRIPGGVSSTPVPGDVYDVGYLQIFQADAVRGYGDDPSQSRGRRVLARHMHGNGVSQAPGGPQSAVAIGLDGSMAALVPAHRALTWQLTDPNGTGVVRERNWLSFQPGEIRVCTACHGINTQSQTGESGPTNAPEALRDLLDQWKLVNGAGPGTPLPTPTAGATRTATPRPGTTPNPGATATPPPTGAGVCASGLVVEKARLRAGVTKGTMSITGSAVIPLPWTGVDLPANGMRIAIAGVLDVVVPGGSGWAVNKKGTRWRFDDPSGTQGGVRRIDVTDQSSRTPGRLTFTIRIAGAPVMPALGPVDAAIRFGTALECAATHWNGPEAAKPRCRGNALRMTCG